MGLAQGLLCKGRGVDFDPRNSCGKNETWWCVSVILAMGMCDLLGELRTMGDLFQKHTHTAHTMNIHIHILHTYIHEHTHHIQIYTHTTNTYTTHIHTHKHKHTPHIYIHTTHTTHTYTHISHIHTAHIHIYTYITHTTHVPHIPHIQSTHTYTRIPYTTHTHSLGVCFAYVFNRPDPFSNNMNMNWRKQLFNWWRLSLLQMSCLI